jgi:hypothetical protein
MADQRVEVVDHDAGRPDLFAAQALRRAGIDPPPRDLLPEWKRG